MEFELIERKKQGKLIVPKKTLSKQVKQSIILLIVTLLLIIISLSIVHLLNTTQASQKGYDLRREEQRSSDLEKETRELDQGISKAKASETLSQSPVIQHMQKPEKLYYVR